MTLDSNDPRRTAYVLGELDDEERRAVEAELEQSPEVRREVEEIRRATELLSSALAAEPVAKEHQVDRAALEAAATTDDARGAGSENKSAVDKPKRRRRTRIVLATAGVAASAAALFLAVTFVVVARQSAVSRRGASAPEMLAGRSGDSVSIRGIPQGGFQDQRAAAATGGRNDDIVVGDFAAAQAPVTPSRDLKKQFESSHMTGAVVEAEALREQRQVGVIDGLGQVESGEVPAANEPTIIYPPVDVWRRLTSEREVDTSGASSSDRDRPDQVFGEPRTYPTADIVSPYAPSESTRLSNITDGSAETFRMGEGYAEIVEGRITRVPPGGAKEISTSTFEGGDITLDLAGAPLSTLQGQDKSGAPLRGTIRTFVGLDPTTGKKVYFQAKDGELSRISAEQLAQRIQTSVEPDTWTDANTEAYDAIVENAFLSAVENPLSTFSIDVDTASYANVRRFLNQNTAPPPGAVRIEELINYFRYDYTGPEDNVPFATHAEVAECPWRPEHRLVRIALKGREIEEDARPPSNLVFLLDVSGSMRSNNKLPLVKQGMRMLVEQLGENDRVAIVVYAGASGLVLDSIPGDQKESILASIDRLEAGGSTNGASGIQLAYQTAVSNFLDEGTNRVILATDGDFNVGTTDQSQLVELIKEKAKSDVFLSVLGFGMGNLKDSTLEKLADKGNGNYAYIDTEREARKVLVEELSGTLVTIAKDVKIQIEFNPAKVAAYRLIGYENRILAKEDFNDDTKDAGEIGAGHTVTALYEVVPAGTNVKLPGVDGLEYQVPARLSEDAKTTPNLATLKLRYKEPEGDTSKLLKFLVADAETRIGQTSDDYQFAAAVAAFGMILRGSQYKGQANLDAVLEMAQAGLGADAEGYRAEFIELVTKAKTLVP